MEQINRKELSAKLKKAMSEEHLWSKDVAQLLNFNPLYISMMLNAKYFDKTSSFAWERLNEWAQQGCSLSDYKFPEGEEVWKEKEKASNVSSFVNIETRRSKKKKDKPVDIEFVLPDGSPLLDGSPLPDITNHPEYMKLVQKCFNLGLQLEMKKEPDSQELKAAIVNTEDQRIKLALDIDINLVLNGQRLKI